jgi:hypothetical protein
LEIAGFRAPPIMRGSLKYLIGLWLIFSGLVFPAMATETPDSLQAYNNNVPVKFVFNFDARYTLFRNDPVRIGGIKAGLEFKKHFRAGIGLYGLNAPVITSFIPTPDQPVSASEMKFRYAAVYGEWVLLKNKRWEVSLPLQLGYGKIQTKYLGAGHTLLQTDRRKIWLAEPAIAGHYKIYSWVGVGAGAGYRQALNPGSKSIRELNAPVYSLKAKIFLGDLYRQFRIRQKNRAFDF